MLRVQPDLSETEESSVDGRVRWMEGGGSSYMKNRQSTLLIIGATAAATTLVTLLVNNFVSGERKIRRKIPRRYGLADTQFERSMSQLMGPPILDGNLITPLENGVEIFPAMLAGIAKAKTTITFETYIFTAGKMVDQFVEALSAKAREGVKVHVLLDGMGCNCVEGAQLQRMRDAGVEVEVYHLKNLGRVNQRTHRKLLVIDGILGFTGGVGIADEWLGDADGPEHWRDMHYQVEGPVVAQLQAAFMDNWMKTHATVLHGNAYFPFIESVGQHRCQMFKSSPMEGSESARLMYLLSITAAEKSLRVGNAYFVPDDLVTETLIAAVKRGVTVEVLVPGEHLDSKLVRHASRHRWGRLLENGVRIFEYQPTMYHCKTMIIDDLWVSVGSANFDNRSFRLNDEANLNVFGEEFARYESDLFEKDRGNSREVTLEEWKRRPLLQKMSDATVALLRSQV